MIKKARITEAELSKLIDWEPYSKYWDDTCPEEFEVVLEWYMDDDPDVIYVKDPTPPKYTLGKFHRTNPDEAEDFETLKKYIEERGWTENP